MKELDKYIRLDSWDDVEALGLEEGFKALPSTVNNWADDDLSVVGESDFMATIRGSASIPFKHKHSSSCRYAYVKKSSLPKKEELFKPFDRVMMGANECTILGPGVYASEGALYYPVQREDRRIPTLAYQGGLRPIPWKLVTSLKDITDAGLELGCEVKDDKGKVVELCGVLWIGDRLVFRVMDSSEFRRSDEIYIRRP